VGSTECPDSDTLDTRAPIEPCSCEVHAVEQMKILAYVDGSRWSGCALRHARRFLRPIDELILLYVAPRGGPGYIESGEMVLEASLHASGLDRAPEATVRPKLCIGDPKEMIARVAEQEDADVILMGAVGPGGFPRRADISETARETMERTNRPVVVCSPQGLELLLKHEGRLVTQPRTELACRRINPARLP
jgi:nucleotide-binding universal stress UspA family protein